MPKKVDLVIVRAGSADLMCALQAGHQGLHFIGEAVDVTGHLSNYNFHWARSLAYICAEALATQLPATLFRGKRRIMAKKRVALEIGMGTSLRQQDYTKAGIRALSDALWHNSLGMAEAFGFPKSAMIVDVEVGVQKPEDVDVEKIAAILPYGKVSVRVIKGGLDIEKPNGAGVTVIANAAVIVSFDMELSEKGAAR